MRLPVPTPMGTKNELAVFVNDVQWTEASTFAEAQSTSASYVSIDDYLQGTTVVFGDGARGARTPTGIENVKARYRTGLGIAGNVASGRIDQVSGSPIGVTGVINPLPASGGADRDGVDQTRA